MRKIGLMFTGLLLILAAVVGCSQPVPLAPLEPSAPTQQNVEEGAVPETTEPPEEVQPASDTTLFTITSPAFVDGAEIPVKYTCNGQNISPALNWAQVPAGTASFALIMDDPDAAYTHWVIYNLPPDSRGLPEAVPKDEKLAGGALQGKIGSGDIDYPTGYFGPCPPKGSAHHCRFTLYALDTSLNLTAGASKEQLLQAMQGHILVQSQLVGLYQR